MLSLLNHLSWNVESVELKEWVSSLSWFEIFFYLLLDTQIIGTLASSWDTSVLWLTGSCWNPLLLVHGQKMFVIAKSIIRSLNYPNTFQIKKSSNFSVPDLNIPPNTSQPNRQRWWDTRVCTISISSYKDSLSAGWKTSHGLVCVVLVYWRLTFCFHVNSIIITHLLLLLSMSNCRI